MTDELAEFYFGVMQQVWKRFVGVLALAFIGFQCIFSQPVAAEPAFVYALGNPARLPRTPSHGPPILQYGEPVYGLTLHEVSDALASEYERLGWRRLRRVLFDYHAQRIAFGTGLPSKGENTRSIRFSRLFEEDALIEAITELRNILTRKWEGFDSFHPQAHGFVQIPPPAWVAAESYVSRLTLHLRVASHDGWEAVPRLRFESQTFKTSADGVPFQPECGQELL